MKLPDQINRRFYSLKFRIILIFSIITFILVGIFTRTGYFYIKKIYLNQLEEQIILITGIIGSETNPDFLDFIPKAEYQMNSTREFYQKFLADQVAKTDLTHAFIFDDKLTIVVHSHQDTLLGEMDPQLTLHKTMIQQLETSGIAASSPFKGKDGKFYMWCFYRLNDDYWLGVRENVRHLQRIDEIARLFWIIGIVGILVTVSAGWILGFSVSRPVNRLVSFSKKIGEGKYEQPVPDKIKGELKELVNALDKMRNDIMQNQREKEEILAQVAHEIRNPLGGIELMSGLIREDMLKHGLDVTHVKKILDEVLVLKNQISTYLEYSRPVKAVHEKIKVRETINEILSTLNFAGRGIQVQLDIQENTLYADIHHFKQIILNLLVNSLAVLDKNGKVIVATKIIEGKFHLFITDNGPGIPSENLDKIFRPFFTTREKGSGLGLSVCQKLCEENNLSLTVDNNTGAGCTFIIQSLKE